MSVSCAWLTRGRVCDEGSINIFLSALPVPVAKTARGQKLLAGFYYS